MAAFIMGAGIWGLTFDRLIAEKLKERIVSIDRRAHIGGNSWSYFDAATGIQCHASGSRIFHKSNEKIWIFITRFGRLTGYRHKVLAPRSSRVYPMPIGLFAINMLYALNLAPRKAREFIRAEAAKEGITAHSNLEEKVLSQIGRPLYETFIRDYTAKQ